jgi:uncharacterized delta-60 repeat protein
VKDYPQRYLPTKRQNIATRNSIILLVILTMMITATVNTTTMQTTQGTPHQNSNTSIKVRELSPSTSTYWAKTYGGTDFDEAYSVQNTTDGGYIVAGETHSFGEGYYEAWVLKLNSTGGVTWQKIYGDSGGNAYSVQQTTDGGYIVAGRSSDSRVWVFKLNSTGDVTWQKTCGASGSEAYSVQQTSDGGYIVAGAFGDPSDVWVAKLNSTGGVTWKKSCGGSSEDCAKSIQQTSDGGYIVAGYTKSFGAGNGDVWVLKLNSTGGVDWQKTYGGGDSDRAYSVQQTSDGGYIVAGGAGGISGDLGFTSGDVWVLKLSSTGDVTWQKTYGGGRTDWAQSVQQTSDGGYIIAGYTYSFGAGTDDFWVLKLDSTGGVTWQNAYGGYKSERAYSVQQTTDEGFIVAGYAYSFGAGYYDFWVVKLGAGGEIVWNGGSGASTHASSVSPSYFGATVSTSSATPASSTTQGQDTHVTPLDSTATVIVQASVGTVQSGGGGGGGTGQGNNLIIIIGGVALVAVVVVISIVGIKMRKK